MTIGTKICRALKSRLGFEHDPPEYTDIVYKRLAPKIALYLRKKMKTADHGSAF
jgi:hypothetical protein